jgi:uncharacterized membrane protein YphA (DoxX/SURF4 family)
VVLFILRAVLGLVILIEGAFYVGGQQGAPGCWWMGLTALVCGALLVIGFLTPIIGGVVAAGTVGVVLSVLPACTPSLFDSKISVIFSLTMLVTIIGIGPGAFSVDARFFGRREIIIPRRIS